jgi:predicted ATPase
MPCHTKLAISKALVVAAITQELRSIIQEGSQLIIANPTLLLHQLPIAIIYRV